MSLKYDPSRGLCHQSFTMAGKLGRVCLPSVASPPPCPPLPIRAEQQVPSSRTSADCRPAGKTWAERDRAANDWRRFLVCLFVLFHVHYTVKRSLTQTLALVIPCVFSCTQPHLEMWLDNSIYSLIIQSVIMVCIFPVICMHLLKYSFKIIAA